MLLPLGMAIAAHVHMAGTVRITPADIMVGIAADIVTDVMGMVTVPISSPGTVRTTATSHITATIAVDIILPTVADITVPISLPIADPARPSADSGDMARTVTARRRTRLHTFTITVVMVNTVNTSLTMAVIQGTRSRTAHIAHQVRTAVFQDSVRTGDRTTATTSSPASAFMVATGPGRQATVAHRAGWRLADREQDLGTTNQGVLQISSGRSINSSVSSRNYGKR